MRLSVKAKKKLEPENRKVELNFRADLLDSVLGYLYHDAKN
jgi:hypothetical protein